MPTSFVIVTRKSTTGASSFSSGFRTAGARQIVLWDINLKDKAQANAGNWNDMEVLASTWADYGAVFPVGGQSLYTWYESWDPNNPASNPSATTRVYPWIRCQLVTAEREPIERMAWRARAEFSSDPRYDLDVPTDLYNGIYVSTLSGVGDYPKLEETIWGQTERIQEEENTDDLPKQDLRLPTGNLYAQPFRSIFPRRTLRITIFEQPASTIEETIESRLFAVSSTAFKGDPAPIFDNLDQPARWMITGAEYQKVWLPYNQAGNVAHVSAYMTTYTVERNAAPGGWWDRRALIDYYYLEQSDDLTTMRAYREPSDAGTIIPCLLLPNGTKKNPQTGEPDYIDYRMQKAIPFTFLQ